MDILRNMLLFVEVAKAGSFRRAAEGLGLPNSTVSRRIAELEKSIGLRLLNRTTRRVELTEGGKVYFARCRRIIEEAQLAHEELGELQKKPGGLIRVSLPVDFGVIFLSPLLAEFSAEYPDIRFDLDLTPRRADLVADPVDVAIRVGAPQEPNLIARPLTSFAMGIYASPDYLARAGTPTLPEHLIKHQCLRMADAPWTLRSITSGETVKLPVSGRFTANNVGMLRRLTSQHLGIVLIAEALVAGPGELQRILPDWAPPPVPVFALTETRLLPAKVRVFIDFLVARLNRDRLAEFASLPGIGSGVPNF